MRLDGLVKEKKTTKSCDEYLSEQVNREVSNSLFYQACEYWCDVKGFTKASAFFGKHSIEEFDHSRKVLKFMRDLDYKFTGWSVEHKDLDFSSLTQVVKDSLMQEQDTTKNLNEIKLHAIEDKAPLVEEFIRGMLVEQIEEETLFKELSAVAEGLREDSKLDMLHLEESFV